MSNSIITPKLKDELLIDLLSVEAMHVQGNIYETAKEFNIESDMAGAVYDQFEEMGLIKQSKCMGGTIIFEIKAKAHDFYNHGCFTVQEEILQANIQKLSDELDLLTKQLSPDLLEKVTSISTIGANILSALGFFKT